MRNSTGFLGLTGVVLLLFAAADLLLTRFAGTFDRLYVIVHVIAGVLALVAYLSTGLEHFRTLVGERSTKYGTNVLLGSVFFIGILVAFNYLAARHHHRFDLTESSVYSLSSQSKKVVQALKEDLHVEAFVEGGVSPTLRQLLESYHYRSPKLSFEMVDPDRHPELARKVGITAYNTVRLQYGKNVTTVTDPSEGAITNAIIKVTRAGQKTVCFLDGHGEPDIDATQDANGMSRMKIALTNENYVVKKILLATMEKVPDECALLIVAGPQRPILDHELKAIEVYLKSGRAAVFLVPPRRAPELGPLLERWGVRLGNDVVVDPVVRLFQGSAMDPVVDTYDPAHEITRNFHQRTLFSMTRSVHDVAAGKAGLQAVEIVKTSKSSWAETDLAALFDRSEAQLDDSDDKGPVPIAVAVEAKLKAMGAAKDGTARLVVFGSVRFATNRTFDNFYNRDLLMNTAGWLVGESDLVSIRPRGLRASRVHFTRRQGTLIFYLSVLVFPEILLLVGLAVWWRRE